MYRSSLVVLALGLAADTRAQVPDFETNWIGWDTSTGSQARWPWAARVGDLDQDGDLDVAAVNWWFYANLSVVLNDGAAAFAQPALYSYSKGALDVELADITGDGALDIVVSNTGANYEGATVSLFRNLGNGTFAAHQAFACAAGPVGLAASDFNGDGRVDIAVACYGGFGNGSQVALLSNNGLGGFLPAVLYPAGASPYKLAAGDLDGDGDADLAVARDAQKVSLLLNTGGTFAAPVTYDTFGYINTDVYPTVALGDVDNDGDLDVLYSSTGLAVGTQSVTALLRNHGNGTLAAAHPIFGSGAMDIAIADVTGDGWLDILGARESSDFWTLTPNDGQGGFQAEQVFAGGENPIEIAAADMDVDGDLDVVVVARDSLEIAVYDNPGNGVFGSPPATALAGGVSGDANADLLDAADVDQDGDLDVVAGYNVIASTQGAVALALGDGAGGFSVTTLPSTKQVIAPKLGDLDGDGLVDLAWADDFPPYDFRTRRNLGGGAFGPEVDHPVGTCGNTGLGLVDVDDDGDLDVCLLEGLACVSVPQSNKRIFISRNRGDGTYDPAYVVISDTSVNDIAGVDLDGNGLTDLVTAQPGSVVVLLGVGGGFFAPKVSYSYGGISLAVEDFDGDSEWDIAVGSPGGFGFEQRVSVHLGNGDGTLAPAANYLASYSYSFTGVTGLAAGDVDADGDVDLLASNYKSDDVSLLRNLGAGTFAPQVRYGAWSNPSDVLFGEFTGDSELDAVVLVRPLAFSFTFALGVLRGKAGVCVPTPAPYCTAKTNSQGCVPAIAFAGCPSATAASGFEIRAAAVLNNKQGLLLYGLGAGAAIPFQGGFLCMQPPIRRTPGLNSGGNPPPNDCSGEFRFDFNAWIAAGHDAALVAGQAVRAQFWSRDAAASFGTNLSDAILFTIGA